MWTQLRQFAGRLRAHLQSAHLDHDLKGELEAHIGMAAEHHMRAGMNEEQAQRTARLELGGFTQLREQHRETRGLPFLDTLKQEHEEVGDMLKKLVDSESGAERNHFARSGRNNERPRRILGDLEEGLSVDQRDPPIGTRIVRADRARGIQGDS